MEGSCDPPKLVSQFLLRKTVVQVRRRILQCCRPGFPDNVIKAFRYQRLLWPMLVACHHVDPSERRPPVEREERVMPLWLARSLPVISPTIKCFNSQSGSFLEAPPPCRSGAARQSHLTFLRSTSGADSFPPGTRYPPRLPENLDFRRIGFVQLQQPLPPPSTAPSSPLSGGQVSSAPLPPPPITQPLSPPCLLLRSLLLSRTAPPSGLSTASTVSMTTRERIRRHCQTLSSLRRRRRGGDEEAEAPPPPAGAASRQVGAHESDDVRTIEEQESEVLLVLSESSPGSAGTSDPERAESGSEQEVTVTTATADRGGGDEDDGESSSDESREPVVLQEGEEKKEDEEDQRKSEDELFAQDYLLRVCDAVQVCPGVSEQLLQLLDGFSAEGPLGAAERLHAGLSRVLRPWPQLLRDFAAFLNRGQARRCGLLLEQQLFERSRRFLRRLGRSLGRGSTHYQQVVSVLQGSPASSSEGRNKISSLLQRHPDLQEQFWEFFQQLHAQQIEGATSCEDTDTDLMSQNPPDGDRKSDDGSETGSEEEEQEEEEQEEEQEQEERPLCAKNISLTSSGEKVVVWTREADRAILTACQQGGATWTTFRRVSALLGNKTAQQVSLRFHDLLSLFHSTFQKPTSCSLARQPISTEDTPVD